MRVDGNCTAGGGISGRGILPPAETTVHRPSDRTRRDGYTWGTATPDPDAVARIHRQYQEAQAAAQAERARAVQKVAAAAAKRRIDLPVQEIRDAREDGATIAELAERYGVNRNTIRRRLAEPAHPRKDRPA